MPTPATSPGLQSNPPTPSGPVAPLERKSNLPDLMNQAHLVSLVLQSKKALQHGEQLCTDAHIASHASAQAAINVLALDAKVQWVIEVVMDQFKLATSVAKSIEEKRTALGRQLYEWDVTRTKCTDALDEILEALGAQLVPPDFHETSADSSLFGSQHPFDIDPGSTSTSRKPTMTPISPSRGPGNYSHPISNGKMTNGASTSYDRPSTSPISPSATLRRNGSTRKNGGDISASRVIGRGSKSRKQDRRHWKTLRDFVDDQAIEDALDMIESDRSNLDAILRRTDDYPETLTRTIQSIQVSLPLPEPDDLGALMTTQNIITEQEVRVNIMASVLETLAGHYDNMANTLREMENGEVFGEEDWQVMNRDSEELPAIMAELEESAHAINGYHGQLATTKDNLEKDLQHLHTVVDDLEELGEIMGEMLATQESVEAKAMEELDALHLHLTTLEQLHEQYVAYRMAFNKLLLEIARRRQYREAAENIVKGMARQLESMTQEEARVRDHFNAEYGQYLPEDLCLCIGNSPTTWDVVPSQGAELEVLPMIDNDLIADAKDRIEHVDGPPGVDSH